ncbi:MAG: UpxY family transcription antiterminator [Paludibacteraceae bacterium]|nr:UpxY family transcription antiterminator [Paludibacteraceae bacterium]
MPWFVLKMKTSSSAIRFRELLIAEKIEFFLPTTKQVVRRGEKEESIERPLLFGYVFVRTEEPNVIRFANANDGISLLRERRKNGEIGPYMRVPDSQMKSFIRAVGQYTDNIPFVSPTPDMLTKGDQVRIIGGPFKGIEGILEAQQGKDGGRVIVRIKDLIAVPTLEIDPSLIQVLKFAPSGRHLYQKLDSFQPRLYKAYDARLRLGRIPGELQDHLQMFVRRFDSLTIDALNARVRYLCYLLLAYALIEYNEAKTAQTLQRLLELKPSIKANSSLDLLNDTFSRFEKLTGRKID